jgi:AraC-like DNA-binding protein
MKTTSAGADRCALPQVFWQALQQLGLPPSRVLRHAGLSATLHMGENAIINIPQLFAIWHAIETVSGDPGFSIRMVRETSTARHKLAFVAGSYAANYRDGLARVARFKRLCSPDLLRIEERHGEVSVTSEWPRGTPPEPALSADASFALMLELGRRGTGRHLLPVGVEYQRAGPGTDAHRAFFGCPIRFGAERDRLVLNAGDLDLPFADHNPELLSILTPALATALRNLEEQTSIGEQVKAALKRVMASGRPDVGVVARELRVSERTLQRRITAEGTTFRALLSEARQELCKPLLADSAIKIDEIAFILGYEDVNSFYRAFREWKNMTPGRWRQANARTNVQARI